jgi:hypothetical protein
MVNTISRAVDILLSGQNGIMQRGFFKPCLNIFIISTMLANDDY